VRTTIDIPDAAYRQLKKHAGREGRSVQSLILRGIEHVLQGKPRARGRRVFPPALPSKRPGTLRIDNAKIYDIIGFP
jgi:hypothetical protein